MRILKNCLIILYLAINTNGVSAAAIDATIERIRKVSADLEELKLIDSAKAVLEYNILLKEKLGPVLQTASDILAKVKQADGLNNLELPESIMTPINIILDNLDFAAFINFDEFSFDGGYMSAEMIQVISRYPNKLPVAAKRKMLIDFLYAAKDQGGRPNRAALLKVYAKNVGPLMVSLLQFASETVDEAILCDELAAAVQSFDEPSSQEKAELHRAFGKDHIRMIRSGSIAHVLLTDTEAIKVLRTNIKSEIENDHRRFKEILTEIRRVNQENDQELSFSVKQLNSFLRGKMNELDLRNEKKLIREMQNRYNGRYKNVRVVELSEFDDPTDDKTLRMKRVPGLSLSSLTDAIVTNKDSYFWKIGPEKFAEIVDAAYNAFDLWYKTAVGNGFAHFDLHAGNMMVDITKSPAQVIFIDAGASGQLGEESRKSLGEFVLGYLLKRPSLVEAGILANVPYTTKIPPDLNSKINFHFFPQGKRSNLIDALSRLFDTEKMEISEDFFVTTRAFGLAYSVLPRLLKAAQVRNNYVTTAYKINRGELLNSNYAAQHERYNKFAVMIEGSDPKPLIAPRLEKILTQTVISEWIARRTPFGYFSRAFGSAAGRIAERMIKGKGDAPILEDSEES